MIHALCLLNSAADREEKIKKGLIVPAKKVEPPKAEAPAAEPPAAPAAPAKPAAPAGEREAAAAAAAGLTRSYEEESLSLDDATAKLTALADTRLAPALELLRKMIANINKDPAEPKYRKMRLSNPKVAAGLVHVDGVRQWLRAIGWRLDGEFIELQIDAEAVAQAKAQAMALEALESAVSAAEEARRVAELERRKAEAAERMAKQAHTPRPFLFCTPMC